MGYENLSFMRVVFLDVAKGTNETWLGQQGQMFQEVYTGKRMGIRHGHSSKRGDQDKDATEQL